MPSSEQDVCRGQRIKVVVFLNVNGKDRLLITYKGEAAIVFDNRSNACLDLLSSV